MCESSIGGGVSTSTKENQVCLVCGRGNIAIIVTNSQSFLKSSGTSLPTFLYKVFGEHPCYSMSDAMCEKCFNLLDKLDCYQFHAATIKSRVLSTYKKTKQDLLGKSKRVNLIASSLDGNCFIENGTKLNICDELTITMRSKDEYERSHVKSRSIQDVVQTLRGGLLDDQVPDLCSLNNKRKFSHNNNSSFKKQKTDLTKLSGELTVFRKSEMNPLENDSQILNSAQLNGKKVRQKLLLKKKLKKININGSKTTNQKNKPQEITGHIVNKSVLTKKIQGHMAKTVTLKNMSEKFNDANMPEKNVQEVTTNKKKSPKKLEGSIVTNTTPENIGNMSNENNIQENMEPNIKKEINDNTSEEDSLQENSCNSTGLSHSTSIDSKQTKDKIHSSTDTKPKRKKPTKVLEKKYTFEDLYNAVREVSTGALAHVAAAKKYNIPSSTLSDHVKGKRKIDIETLKEIQEKYDPQNPTASNDIHIENGCLELETDGVKIKEEIIEDDAKDLEAETNVDATVDVASSTVSVNEEESEQAPQLEMVEECNANLLQSFLSGSLWFNHLAPRVDKDDDDQDAVEDFTSENSQWYDYSKDTKENRKKRQDLKNSGQSYINTKGKLIEARKVHYQDCSRCLMKCNQRVSEEDRLKIFAQYWGLADYDLQREYLAEHMDRDEKPTIHSAMKTVISYYLKLDDKKIPVCRQFFLKTLDVSEKASRLVLEKKMRGEFVGKRVVENKKPEEEEDDQEEQDD